MTIQYDETKNQSNIRKHKISFDATIIFFKRDSNPDVEFDEDHSCVEERYRGTFRWDDHYLFISYTMRGEEIRLISARPATKHEIKRYYERE